jgi:tetratricopeptide (TPR) repeat protein
MKGGIMGDQALAQRAFFLKQFDASISHELVVRALDKLADLRDASFYFKKGEEHRLRNEISLAISYYERALKIDKEHTDSLFFLGWCYLGGSDETTGEDIIDDVQISDDEREKRACYAYKRLIDILRRESENSYFYCSSYHNYSVAFRRLGKYNDALDCCYHAIRIMQDFAPAHRHLASIKRQMGLYQEALKDCERALEIDDERERSYNMLGLIQMSMGKNEEAIESFREAIDCNPLYVFPYLNLNEQYRYQRRFPEAIEILDNAIALNPKYAIFYYYYALTDDEIDNESEAAKYYGKFLRLVPAKSEYYKEKIKHAHKRLRELQKIH